MPYYRYEKGMRRRASDVYRDKVFEWTLSAAARKRHKTTPGGAAANIYDDMIDGEGIMLQVIKDHSAAAQNKKLLQTSMNNVKMATRITTAVNGNIETLKTKCQRRVSL